MFLARTTSNYSILKTWFIQMRKCMQLCCRGGGCSSSLIRLFIIKSLTRCLSLLPRPALAWPWVMESKARTHSGPATGTTPGFTRETGSMSTNRCGGGGGGRGEVVSVPRSPPSSISLTDVRHWHTLTSVQPGWRYEGDNCNHTEISHLK